MLDLSTNTNTRWAAVFVRELALAGLEAVCIAPGSRSTPLALAFAAEPSIRVYTHLDERSAGFFGLGMALSSGKPVALVCTSGTAAANFHPAVIEAYYSNVPLLVLTADRPPELRESGANQTIDQIKMFGDHVRWAVEMPVPQENPPAVTVRHLRTLAARAYAMADGLSKGPVHLNFPFRKPLEPEPSAAAAPPTAVNREVEAPYTQFGRGLFVPSNSQLEELAEIVNRHPRGIIICGPRCPGSAFPHAVAELSRASGYPVIADGLSGVRFGPHADGAAILGAYDLWLPRWEADDWPEVVLRFGAVPTSAALGAFLERVDPLLHLLVREDGQWADDLHRLSRHLQADPTALALGLSDRLTARGHTPDSHWTSRLQARESTAVAALSASLVGRPFFDGMAVDGLLRALPNDSLLFAGNSLAVRHLDLYGVPTTRRIEVFGNRGASGIDGNVSTALGIAAATGRHVVALVGDITLYHDMNGLLAVRRHGLSATFVVLNNDGGGIFRRLPVARHELPFRELFLTPHGLGFEDAARMYGLEYWQVTNGRQYEQALEDAFAAAAAGPVANLIEVRTDSRLDYSLHGDIMRDGREALAAQSTTTNQTN